MGYLNTRLPRGSAFYYGHLDTKPSEMVSNGRGFSETVVGYNAPAWGALFHLSLGVRMGQIWCMKSLLMSLSPSLEYTMIIEGKRCVRMPPVSVSERYSL